jgi:DNA modification methylase
LADATGIAVRISRTRRRKKIDSDSGRPLDSQGDAAAPTGPNTGSPEGVPPKHKLYYGDNLEVLRSRILSESVDLCYIDPPFNSKRNYNQIYNNLGQEDRAQAQAFVDTWVWDEHAIRGYGEIITNAGTRFSRQTIELIRGLHSVLGEGSILAYVVSITLRVVEIQRVLKPTGSLYLHCDPTASHYLKLLLDSVFLPNGGDFKNEVIWRRTGAHSAKKRFGPIHDTILFYTKRVKATDYYFKSLLRPYMLGHVESRYTRDDKGYKFTSGGNVLTGAGATRGESGMTWRGFDPSAKNRHWAVPGFLVEQIEEDGFADLGVLEKLDRLYEEGLIEIIEGQAWPQPVRYLNPLRSGQRIQDIWAYQPYTEGAVFGSTNGIDSDVAWLGPTDPERLGWETQKPQGLLERIIRSSCPPGGVVLDAYCGCGTTVYVAQQLGLSWIGIDITYQSISIILKQLERKFGPDATSDVVIDGIPKDMESAAALAHKQDDRLRKEFEKWAVLTYTNNRAIVNPKKGADEGVDGIVFFLTSRTESARMILQVKSGIVTRKDIAALRGDMEREQAPLAALITLEEPTQPMRSEAKAAGLFESDLTGQRYRIQIVTVKEIIEQGRRLELPLTLDATKNPIAAGVNEEQRPLFE